jgi:hypothetical protein
VPEKLRPLTDGVGVVQQTAAIAQQLLALPGQQQPAADTIEQLETQLLLQIADLPRQGGLGNAQAQRRLGDGTELRHSDEGPRAPQVHVNPYAGTV